MNYEQSDFSLIKHLIVEMLVPVGSPRERTGYRTAWPAILRALILFTLFALSFLNSTSVMGQNQSGTPDLLDKSLEDLMAIQVDSVYCASGFNQKVTEAPASVTFITSEEIQKYGYRTLADILRNVRDFYVTYDRNYSYLGARGYPYRCADG